MSEASRAKKRVRLGLAARSALFFALLACSIPITTSAAVEITKVEYDVPGADEGREWIEITNKGTGSVDVSKFKFLEGGVNHKLTLAAGSAVLAPGGSAVIASDPATYMSEHSGSGQNIFKSSFSLSNSGETLALVNEAGKVEHSMSYTATPKPKPAPAAKATSKSPTAKTKTAKSSAATPGDLVYTDPEDLVAAAGTTTLPPMLVWWAGLGGIIALGTAGTLWARMQKRARVPETLAPGAEFEIVEN